MTFEDLFRQLTRYPPFPYQQRLAEQPWPTLLDIPTGLGKTAAVTIAWLFKRLQGDPDTGTRLVYCLPMRVLVEQTHSSAMDWCDNAAPLFEEAGLLRPSVHVLMGGDVDESWQREPERPAILIGTQDMLLSRALNRGYAMSRYKWPVHFALLNNDCLWVFDETQLVGVGIETSAQLQALRDQLGVHTGTHTVWMSATLASAQLATVDHPEPPQGWSTHALTTEDAKAPIVQQRTGATKPLVKVQDALLDKASDKKGYIEALATKTLDEHQRRGGLTLVIVNRVNRAQALYKKLIETKERTDENTALVHARFRRADRAEQEALLQGTGDRIVVATQAVEAGVDVSARTMVTELAPWPSLVQRFGRCNRYGGEDAVVLWTDIDTADVKSGVTLPYEPEDLDEARKLLGLVTEHGADAGPARLKEVHFDPRDIVRPVLRRRDVLDLFDTTPDLSGNDVDVSRYVRDGEDTDVQIYWRTFEEEPSPAMRQTSRDELCRVAVSAARDFIKKLHDKRNKLGGSSKDREQRPRLTAWSWNPLDREWEQVSRVFPGQILLLHSAAGGYDPALGWTGEVAPKTLVPEVPVKQEGDAPVAAESFDDDGGTILPKGVWVRLTDHLGHVRDEARALAETLRLLGETRDALATAGLWHDVGKAHEAFQSKLLDPVEDEPSLRPSGEGPWAKSNHRLKTESARPHFRHELASALAWLQAGGAKNARFESLVAYLIAAHHGKVRLSIRSLPGEAQPEDPSKLFARGVWDGDGLQPLDLPDDRRLEGVRLDLSVMRLGEGSWLERMLRLRDDGDLGPFRLALLETVVRIADWRASQKEEEGWYDARS